MEMTVSETNQPIFGVAMRILQFRREALGRRTPWPLRDAAAALELSTKSIKRYVTFLALTDTDSDGNPLIQIVRKGGRPYIESRAKRRAGDPRPQAD